MKEDVTLFSKYTSKNIFFKCPLVNLLENHLIFSLKKNNKRTSKILAQFHHIGSEASL